MAIIDPKGLFLGDRLSWCSDDAQLHWTRLYAAANNYARLELNYRKVVAAGYSSFKKPPTEAQFWAWIKEYRDNFLLFVYQADGVIWGQWQTNERYLLGHKSAEDRRSPSPPIDQQDDYRNAYLEAKSVKCKENQTLADLLEVVSSCNCNNNNGHTGTGVGVGGGNRAKALVRFTSDEIEAIYQQYPRKEAKGRALPAIKKALINLDGEDPVSALKARVMLFAKSPAGNKGQYVPLPASWFNDKRYLDDPKEWEK